MTPLAPRSPGSSRDERIRGSPGRLLHLLPLDWRGILSTGNDPTPEARPASSPPRKHRGRWLLWGLLGLLGLVLVLVAGALIYLTGPAGEARVQALVVQQANEQLSGRLEVGGLDLGPRSVILTGLKLYDPEGELVAEVDRVEARLALAPLVRKHVVLRSARVEQPHLYLHQDERGLNLSRAIAPRQPKPEDPNAPRGTLRFTLEELPARGRLRRLRGGGARGQPRGAPGGPRRHGCGLLGLGHRDTRREARRHRQPRPSRGGPGAPGAEGPGRGRQAQRRGGPERSGARAAGERRAGGREAGPRRGEAAHPRPGDGARRPALLPGGRARHPLGHRGPGGQHGARGPGRPGRRRHRRGGGRTGCGAAAHRRPHRPRAPARPGEAAGRRAEHRARRGPARHRRRQEPGDPRWHGGPHPAALAGRGPDARPGGAAREREAGPLRALPAPGPGPGRQPHRQRGRHPGGHEARGPARGLRPGHLRQLRGPAGRQPAPAPLGPRRPGLHRDRPRPPPRRQPLGWLRRPRLGGHLRAGPHARRAGAGRHPAPHHGCHAEGHEAERRRPHL